MDDLTRMEKYYKSRKKNLWSIFDFYNFYLSCKQTYILTKILQKKKLNECKILDIGAGEGNFLLKLIIMGAVPQNITAIEFLKDRFDELKNKIPNAANLCGNYLNFELENNHYDIITVMAVLSSLTDNKLRYRIVEKALKELSEGGLLVIYDYFKDDERFLNENYRAVSLEKIRKIAYNLNVTIWEKVYLKSRYGSVLKKLKLQLLIPIIEYFKIFNDSYHFVVIEK